MNLTLVRKYNKLLRKTDGILLHNPLLTLGLALPLAIIPSYGLIGTAAVSVAMLVCFVPTVFLSGLIGNRLPLWLRVVVYPLVSCLLLIPARYLVQNISPLIFDTLGVYFSLICVNSLLMYSIEKVQNKKPVAVLTFALRQWLGACLIAFLCGAIRELLANGSLWGFVILKDLPRLPVAQMALGGFILFGFLAALCRLIHRLILSFSLKAGSNLPQSSTERGEAGK